MFVSFPDVITELVAILLLAAVIGIIAVRLRQPLLIAFIIVGILIGPSGFKWVRSADQIHVLAEMGLAILLFVVGLRLDLKLIKSMGAVALATGLGQVVFTTIGGFAIALALGMNAVTALYVAVALTFSSTIIIVKMLSDKHEADSLHGRIALGILIVQDMVVVLAMIALSALVGDSGQSLSLKFAFVMLKGLGLIAGIGVFSLTLLPRLLNRLASNVELLVVFAITWALSLSTLSHLLGFSKEVGAFLAGISLASTPYRDILGAKLVGLRDFLLIFFFLELGADLNLGALGSQVYKAIPLSLFVLIGNPVLVMVTMGLMGFRKRTSFLTGLTVAQISEFSLILIAMGAQLGHIGSDAVGLVTLIGLVTIGASTYLILYSQNLYERFSPYLSIFEKKLPKQESMIGEGSENTRSVDVILFGLGRYGSVIARELNARDLRFLAVDFDPYAVKDMVEQGVPAVFGDAEDPEFLTTLPLSGTKWVLNSVRDPNINRALINGLKHSGYTGNLAFTADDETESRQLVKLGVDLVYVPFEDAAVEAVDLLQAKEQEIRRKKMDEIIEKLSDHYIICGYGRMGQQIVKDLQRDGVPFVVVETNPEQLPKLAENDIPYVEGKASEDKTLLKAGIRRAKGLISVAPTDEDNVFIVLTARGLNRELFIVARSILEENEDKLKRAGADRVMSPYILGGHRMATSVVQPDLVDFLDLVAHSGRTDVTVGTVKLSNSSPSNGKTLGQLNVWQACGVTVLAVRRDGDLYANPEPEYVLQAEDELILMGTDAQINAARECITA